MDTDKYRLLLKTIEMGNLTKAAASMGYTQSGASHVINAIETELGIHLLQRGHFGVRPTPEAVMLLPMIRNSLACEDQLFAMANSINGLQSGLLKISAFTSVCMVWLPQIISRFHQLYPNIQVEILTGSGSYREMENFLSEGIVDCSFVCSPASASVESVPIYEDPLLLVLPPNHPLSFRSDPIDFSDLVDIPFLMPGEGNNSDILRLCKQYGFSPKVAFTMHDDLTLLAMAEQGLGCTILPGLIIDNFKYHTPVRPLKEHPTRTISLAVRSNTYPSPLLKAFFETVASVLKLPRQVSDSLMQPFPSK